MGRNNSLPFLYCDSLPGAYVCQLVGLSAWPLDFNCIRFIFLPESKARDELALREIARAAADHLPLFFIARHNPEYRANAIAVRLGANQLDAQAVICRAFVAEQVRTSTIGGHEHIQRAVVVYVRISCAAADTRCCEDLAERLGDLNKLSAAQI